MKRALLAISLIAFSSMQAYAFDKVYEMKLEDLEDLIIKENGIRINNFSIAERRAFLAKGLVNIEVSFSARNKNNVSKHFSVMIVGKSGDSIIWAVSAEPIMSTISANKTETVEADSYVVPGTLGKTESVWLRVVGDF